MVLFIAGATHTGKTLLAQRLLETYKYPYLSIDHLKMGLIRSGNTALTPESPDEALTAYLWPIVREMAKTAIENQQNLVIEGCYIPYHFKQDFGEEYLPHIKSLWLIFSKSYIERHFADILKYESAIERRATAPHRLKQTLAAESERDWNACVQNNLPYVLVEDSYSIDLERFA